MKKVFALLVCLLPGLSFAVPLTEALAQADNRSDVVNADLARDDAAVALSRTEADPLALRLEQAQARQRAALTRAQLRQARYRAIADIAAAYTQLLEAQLQRDLAAAGFEVSAQSLDIARIRFDKGSATALDVQEAENALQDAEKNSAAAVRGVALAKTNLEGLIGQEVETVEPVPESLLAPLPSLETVLQNAATSPTLLQVDQGVELAGIGADLLDPSYASQAQLDNAALQLEQAQESAKEAGRGLEIQARSLYNTVTSAAQTYQNAQAALKSAQEREALEKQRLNAGLIADISFKQAQLTSFQALLAATQAKHALLNALLELQAGTMTALEGLHEF